MRTAAALLGLLLTIGVTGCSGDPGPESPVPSSAAATTTSSTPTPEPTETASGALTDAVLTSALLTVADVPDGFRDDTLGSGDADDVGCLASTAGLDRLGAESAARVGFVAEDESGAAGVLAKVYSDGDVTVLRRGLTRFAAELRGCPSVDVTDDDGARTRLEITTDRRRTSPAVGAQVTFTGIGTVGGAGRTFPYRVRYSVSLVGRTLVVIAGYEVGTSLTGLLDLPALGTLVIDRLVAAGAGT